MAASQEYIDKALLRRSYRNVWHTDLTSAIQADFPYCCLSLWCGPCVSYMLRRRALYNDMSRYVCCAGYMPCSGRCGKSKCPELCLATESFMFCLQQLACICSLVACIVGNQELSEASLAISCVSDTVYWTVCSCMQTQHKVEMDKRDGKLGGAAMSDAADVTHRSAGSASGRVCAAASVLQVVLWDLGLPLRVGNGWRSSS